MLLWFRHEEEIYEIEMPEGSRIELAAYGKSILIIPGRDPGETGTVIPYSAVLAVAQQGRFGLILRGKVPTVTPDPPPTE
jgi:hypothetical protein